MSVITVSYISWAILSNFNFKRVFDKLFWNFCKSHWFERTSVCIVSMHHIVYLLSLHILLYSGYWKDNGNWGRHFRQAQSLWTSTQQTQQCWETGMFAFYIVAITESKSASTVKFQLCNCRSNYDHQRPCCVTGLVIVIGFICQIFMLTEFSKIYG